MPIHSFMVSPFSPIDYGSVKVGVSAPPITVSMGNLSQPTLSMTINSITIDAVDGWSAVGLPALPYVLSGNGSSVSFILNLIPGAVGSQSFPAVVDINYTVTGFSATDTLIAADYTGYLLTPAFSITNTTKAFLIGLLNATPTTTIMQVNPANLNCEEPSHVSQQLDFDSPDLVKTIARWLVRYERMGVSTFTITASTNSPVGQAPVVQTRVIEASVDGTLNSQLFDGAIAAEILQVLLSRTANSGPLSITLYAPYYELRGEKIEAT